MGYGTENTTDSLGKFGGLILQVAPVTGTFFAARECAGNPGANLSCAASIPILGLTLLRGPKVVGRVARDTRAAEGGKRTVIGKVKDLDELGPGENTLLKHLSNQGNPKANWKQNSGVLRREMGKGRPIRDASVDPATGQLINYPGSFINAERGLLRDRGWSYDPTSRLWNPPG